MRPALVRVPPWPVTEVTNGSAPVTAAVLLLGDRSDRKHHFPPNFLIETFYRDFGENTLFRSPRSPRLCPLTSSETKRPVTFGHSGHRGVRAAKPRQKIDAVKRTVAAMLGGGLCAKQVRTKNCPHLGSRSWPVAGHVETHYVGQFLSDSVAPMPASGLCGNETPAIICLGFCVAAMPASTTAATLGK